MKRVLGLDLGTNSIGWALVNTNENNEYDSICKLGSRIIPMTADAISDFDKGTTQSATSERTRLRSMRRLLERSLLRRERMHRVLKILGFLPSHYQSEIDFSEHPGKFLPNHEPKLAYRKETVGEVHSYQFIFKEAFNEMLQDFAKHQPQLVANNRLVPYDWTIYYLRKKALTQAISKEELAWILMQFNQKRGAYQLRDDIEIDKSKQEEYCQLRVKSVTVDEGSIAKKEDEKWYTVVLENDWIYRRTSRVPLDWEGKIKEFIVTTEFDELGVPKKTKDGEVKRTFRVPNEDDWTLIKSRTEKQLDEADKDGKTVGVYIYDALLADPNQKIKGGLIRTIERNYYKSELKKILCSQKRFHKELTDKELYKACVGELYKMNEHHRTSVLTNYDTIDFLINDLILYQRPLKSKKSLIDNCSLESRSYFDKESGEVIPKNIKCIAKSHPLFQEFRLWQFIHNLDIIELEVKTKTDLLLNQKVTNQFLTCDDDYTAFFDWLNERKEVSQEDILAYPGFKLKKGVRKEYRWNYSEDNKKKFPCNTTRSEIIKRLKKLPEMTPQWFTTERELMLWEILYSVNDKYDIIKALTSFAKRQEMNEAQKDAFVEQFKNFPKLEQGYGSYSAKAIKRLLPLMRRGKYWSSTAIDQRTMERINHFLSEEKDGNIRNSFYEKVVSLRCLEDFAGLSLPFSSYIVYNRHSESSDIRIWNSPEDIDTFLFKHFKQGSMRNPVVEQIVSETLRLVRDIWKHYGKIHEIHVEMGREMRSPAEKRKRMASEVSANENTNLRIKALLLEMSHNSEINDVRPYSPSQQEILRLYEEGALATLDNKDEQYNEITSISKMSNPSRDQLTRYRCWLEQRYRSPYTGKAISFTKLFTSAYQIEHIIPQSRFYDDSFSNKVICESIVNAEKDNKLAYEFIAENEGRNINIGEGQEVKLFTLSQYQEFVQKNFLNNRLKKEKLLMKEIPNSFSSSQLNNSRYIARTILSLLSSVVREKDETTANSKHVIPSNGIITTRLKKDWGMNDVWNHIVAHRFERLNKKTNSSRFGAWKSDQGKRYFQVQIPLENQKGFSKKRIDHRHHALDALIVACTTRNIVNLLNNESGSDTGTSTRYELKRKLCRMERISRKKIDNGVVRTREVEVSKEFLKPWNTFTQDAERELQDIVVSFKQNTRIINKTVNRYTKLVDGKRITVKQIKGDSWAIRKPLHKDTVAGRVSLQIAKRVLLKEAVQNYSLIVDKKLRKEIIRLMKLNETNTVDRICKHFKALNYQFGDKDVSKVDVYDYDCSLVASRVSIDTSFDQKKIEKITDKSIRDILIKHLVSSDNDSQLAFSPEGIERMNLNLQTLNNGAPHLPIYKARVSEALGSKFNVGVSGNKNTKYVEAAKGTNLFWGIYSNKEGKRTYTTIPLNIVIERLKQGLPPLEEVNKNGDTLLLWLSPGDLVYVPTQESSINSFNIYKAVSFTGSQCFFVPHTIALPILSPIELGANNKAEKAWDGQMIKEVCKKIKVDRLGKIQFL